MRNPNTNPLRMNDAEFTEWVANPTSIVDWFITASEEEVSSPAIPERAKRLVFNVSNSNPSKG